MSYVFEFPQNHLYKGYLREAKHNEKRQTKNNFSLTFRRLVISNSTKLSLLILLNTRFVTLGIRAISIVLGLYYKLRTVLTQAKHLSYKFP